MIGLETYIDHLGMSIKQEFDRLVDFRSWMVGSGFDRDIGGIQAGSPIMRKLESHALSRPGKQVFIVIGPKGGHPPVIVELRAIVSCITGSDNKRHFKPIHGLLWLSNHIITARHARLVLNIQAAKQYRRDKKNSPRLEAEVREMIDEL